MKNLILILLLISSNLAFGQINSPKFKQIEGDSIKARETELIIVNRPGKVLKINNTAIDDYINDKIDTGNIATQYDLSLVEDHISDTAGVLRTELKNYADLLGDSIRVENDTVNIIATKSNLTEYLRTVQLIDSLENLRDSLINYSQILGDSIRSEKSDIGHDHNSAYYLKSEITTLLNDTATSVRDSLILYITMVADSLRDEINPPIALNPVQNFSFVSKTQTSLTFSWDSYAVQSVDGFEVYLSTVSQNDLGAKIDSIIPPANTLHIIDSLTIGTNYWVKIRVKDGSNYSAFSSTFQVATLDTFQLEQTIISADAGNGQVVLSWTPVDSADSYQIYYGTIDDFDGSSLLKDTTVLTYTHTGLTNGVTIYYWAVAVAENYYESSPSTTSALPVSADTATYLSLFMTDNELELWQQRWIDPAYATEVSAIKSWSDTKFYSQGKAYYNGANDPEFFNMGLVQAAFRSMVSDEGNTLTDNYKQAVRDYIFTASGYSNNELDDHDYRTEAPVFHYMNWFIRCIVAYDMLKNETKSTASPVFSAGDKTAIEGWLLASAVNMDEAIHTSLGMNFPNRYSEDYSVTGNVAYSGTFNVGELTHIESNGNPGLQIYGIHRWYNNRRLLLGTFMSLVAYSLEDSTLIEHSNILWRETMKMGVFPNGMVSDYERHGDYGHPMQGLIYGATNVQYLATVAEIASRSGDNSLYEYSTTDGIFTSKYDATYQSTYPYVANSGAKTLDKVIRNQMNLANEEVNVYHQTVDPDYRLDYTYRGGTSTIDPANKIWIQEAWTMFAARYYNSDYYNNLYSRIKQRITLYPGYTLQGPSGQAYYYGGSSLHIPHLALMWGDWTGIGGSIGGGENPTNLLAQFIPFTDTDANGLPDNCSKAAIVTSSVIAPANNFTENTWRAYVNSSGLAYLAFNIDIFNGEAGSTYDLVFERRNNKTLVVKGSGATAFSTTGSYSANTGNMIEETLSFTINSSSSGHDVQFQITSGVATDYFEIANVRLYKTN